MVNTEATFAALKAEGAILEAHFQYASGRHGSIYVEKFRILERPARTAALCRQLADHFRSRAPEIVVGPTTGGILLAHETAQSLGPAVKAYFAESASEGGRFLGRGFQIDPGQRVLVVDDVLTTGGSIRDTVAAVERVGGVVVGIGVIVDRANGRVGFGGVECFACLSLDVASYDPSECAQCAAGVPLTVT